MAVRLANPQLVITSDHFTQHRRPSTAVLHISIEELRSEQAVTTAPSATKHVSFRLWQLQSGKAQKLNSRTLPTQMIANASRLVDRLKNTCDSGFSNCTLSRRRHPHPVKYGYLRSLLAAKINNGSAANA